MIVGFSSWWRRIWVCRSHWIASDLVLFAVSVCFLLIAQLGCFSVDGVAVSVLLLQSFVLVFYFCLCFCVF